MRCLICEAPEKHEKSRLGRLIDSRCEKVDLLLFGKGHKHAKGDVYTPVFEIMKQPAVKAFFTGGVDELLGGKMYKLDKSQVFRQGLVSHLTKSSTFSVPVTRFVKQ